MVGLLATFDKLTNKQKVLTFLVCFVIMYIYSQGTSKNISTFFILAFAITYYLIYMKSSNDITSEADKVAMHIGEMEKRVATHNTQAMVLEHVYKIHKPLQSLSFIKDNDEASEIVYELRFMNAYDEQSYIDMIVWIEYFLKIHYNIMIGKYDTVSYVSILKDIRYELLNTLQTTHFNIPNLSTMFDAKNLDDNLKQAILRIQAMTYRYLNIIFNKYRKSLHHVDIKGFLANDPGKNDKFHIY